MGTLLERRLCRGCWLPRGDQAMRSHGISDPCSCHIPTKEEQSWGACWVEAQGPSCLLPWVPPLGLRHATIEQPCCVVCLEAATWLTPLGGPPGSPRTKV